MNNHPKYDSFNAIIKKYGPALFFCCLILIGEYVFYYKIIGNDGLIGNRIDGRLNTLFAEHWYQVFRGNEPWMELPAFYPASNVLSYSDIMLGFAIPHSIFRIMGFDIYLSFKYSVILVHVLGSIALFFFMRKCLATSYLCSFLAVVGFSFSNGYYFLAGNPQMTAQSLLPFLFILVYYYFKNVNNKKRYVCAFGGLGLLILLFYTAFYVAYFFCIFMFLWLLLGFLTFLLTNRVFLFNAIKAVLSRWKELFLYAAYCVILMIPFLILYLPTFGSIGGRTWEEISMYSPSIRGLIGLSTDNPLGLDPTQYHLKTGIPIQVLLLLVLGFIIWVCLKPTDTPPQQKDIPLSSFGTPLAVSLFLTCIVSLFLVIKWDNGFSLWYYVYKVVPGASALRALDRWNAFIVLPISILTAWFLERIRLHHHIIGSLVLIAVTLVVYTANYSTVGICSTWNASDENNFISSVAVPPKDCQIMYITDKLQKYTIQDFSDEELQMDAWTIAYTYSLKTVNGYSGQIPDGWDLRIRYKDIDERVMQWMQLNHMDTSHLYAYDIGTNTWTKAAAD